MSDTYVPGFSNALQRYALGGRARAVSDNSDTYAMPSAGYSTKPELAANLKALLAAKQAGQNPEMDPVEARLVAGMQQPTYSPEFQGYLTSVNDYMAGLGNPEVGQFYRGIPLGRSVAGPAGGIKVWNPESAVSSYAQKPVEQNVGYYASLYDGSSDGLLGSGPAGAVNVQYNTPIVLVNNRTGEIVAQGTGLQSAQDIVKAAQGLSKNDAGKANWSIFTGEPGATDPSAYKQVAYDTPNRSALGLVADVALPALGAVALGPLGAAVGSGLSGVAQGRSLGDVLKGAALSGALTAGFGQIMGPVSAGPISAASATTSGLASGTASGLASGAASGLAASIPGQIVVQAIKSGIAPALVGALSGAAAGVGSGILGGSQSIANKLPQLQQQPTRPAPATGAPEFVDPNQIVSVANIGKLTPAQIAAAGTLGAGGLGAIATSPNAPVSQPSSGVQQQPTQQPTTQQPVNPNDIVVNANVPPKLDLGTIGSITGAAGLGGLLTSPVTLPSTPAPQLPPAEKKGILDQIGELSTLDKIRLAGLGLGTIGDLFSGGGGSASPGTIPGGLNGGLNSVFTKTLPTANMPAATPRTAQDLDYYRYGYGPQQSFFNNAPAGLPNTSQAYTGYAEGGEVGESAHTVSPFAVGGPGDGRDDKIPAMLSDGEYVMDAETVSLLGNGSSKAGAKMLDKFRVNVRKQKGRKLAKGAFSDDAKAPEHYLKGRK